MTTPAVNHGIKLAVYFQKHGTTSKPLKAVRLDTEEQEKIAKSGLEMKLITSEMDAETEKWQESNTQVEVLFSFFYKVCLSNPKTYFIYSFVLYSFALYIIYTILVKLSNIGSFFLSCF